ncbi:TIGR03618 family F420-dependent PPOX class oxidoreductase [Streptomyces goshikiensis]|uniref:pyridoxamine 5'-phosphate oxidase family protein n=1 Tax=Streptomyces TaxID=1883 RepID=UPI00099CB875|nr:MULTISPECIES: TIGR03618 family F420-dependent PPOX class oxidoreductase [Streptomyces]MCX4718258.1 TIGR03618 family F420-dependent PPOX class oxidoreductase [Streptomyces virginiae]WSX97099.1 TIGR03618 family F420-dependent PPOX class oxidoreductase [Streptomyces goshikiensis]
MATAINKTDAFVDFWSEYHLATLTTLRPDGTPHVVPVGVTYDHGAGVARVITRKSSVKVTNILSALPGEARVAVSQVAGPRWLTIEGVAEVRTAEDEVSSAVNSYADRYGRRPAPDPERVVLEITPVRTMGRVELPTRS